MTDTEYITGGEFSRWAEGDRAWKVHTTETLQEQGERIKGLETFHEMTQRTQALAITTAVTAENASNDAATTKKWVRVGSVIAAIVNGVIIAWASFK